MNAMSWSIRFGGAVIAAALSCANAHALDSRRIAADGAQYRVVTLDLSRETLELHWLDADGKA